ncbi:MAG: hypothetical protein C0518_08605 [Opitutus sp.]|nr:hypothetical protein [Opitutus sp.]
MTRNIFIFLGTFIAGALIALVARAAWFEPHAAKEANATGGGDYAPMVTNTLAPAKPDAKPAPATDEHAAHGAPKESANASSATQPVNTVCAICGMDVDPKIPTATYQGKTIGFGCKMCPPKFKKEPDRWGPLYLKNEVAKR